MPCKEEKSELERKYLGGECPADPTKEIIMISIYISDR